MEVIYLGKMAHAFLYIIINYLIAPSENGPETPLADILNLVNVGALLGRLGCPYKYLPTCSTANTETVNVLKCVQWNSYHAISIVSLGRQALSKSS